MTVNLRTIHVNHSQILESHFGMEPFLVYTMFQIIMQISSLKIFQQIKLLQQLRFTMISLWC